MTVEIMTLAVLIFIACVLIYVAFVLYEIQLHLADDLMGEDAKHNRYIRQELEQIRKHTDTIKNSAIDINVNTMRL